MAGFELIVDLGRGTARPVFQTPLRREVCATEYIAPKYRQRMAHR